MSEKSDPKPEQGPSPIGEISQEPSAFDAFLDANQKRLMVIGIIGILALVGYVIITGLQKKSLKDAAGAVAAGRTVPDYETLSKTYEGENAGGTALLLKAEALWSDGQQTEAISTVEDFISKYPDHPSYGDAHTKLGSYLQQVEQLDKAKAAFMKSAETKSSTSSIALLTLGDIALQAGEEDKAKEFYDRIITEYESTHLQVKGFAQQRLKLIGVKPPVEKRPEPPKPITPPTGTTPPTTFPGFTPNPLQPTPTTPPATPDPVEPPDPAPKPETGETTTGDLPDLPVLDTPQETTPPTETGSPSE